MKKHRIKKLCPSCKKVMNKYKLIKVENIRDGSLDFEMKYIETEDCGCVEQLEILMKALKMTLQRKFERDVMKTIFPELKKPGRVDINMFNLKNANIRIWREPYGVKIN